MLGKVQDRRGLKALLTVRIHSSILGEIVGLLVGFLSVKGYQWPQAGTCRTHDFLALLTRLGARKAAQAFAAFFAGSRHGEDGEPIVER